MEAVDSIENPWGFLAVSVFVLVPALFGFLQNKTKKGSDEKDTPQGNAIDLLNDRLTELLVTEKEERARDRDAHERERAERDRQRELDREKISALQKEMKEVAEIARVKYPAASGHIKEFHQMFPTSGLKPPDAIVDEL